MQRQAERDLTAQQARRPVELTDQEMAWLTHAGADVRAIFEAPSTASATASSSCALSWPRSWSPSTTPSAPQP